MLWIAILVTVALGALPLYISIQRATELFVLSVRSGEVRFVRGRIPPELLNDMADVAKASGIERARITALRRSGRAELVVRGHVAPEALQRLRNCVGRHPLQRIRAGARPARTTRRR